MHLVLQYKTMTKHKTPTNDGSNNKQSINKDRNSRPHSLATDACLTADPGFASLIPARFQTLVEIDHDFFYGHSPPTDSFKKGCCQLEVKVCAPHVQACPGKSVVR